jgi:Ca2+-binding EF-hand superfamily protein
LKQCLNKEGLGYAELRRIMDSIDTDHNGKINYTEFLASASGNNLFDEKNIKRAFNMLDIDGNGFV